MQTNFSEVIVIGAGAAGLFCAAELGQAGKQVTILDAGKKIGRKILMSGGGYCNFTNLDVQASHYLSNNPHFVKSALARFNQWDFIGKVLEYDIPYHEKEDGQLFCDRSSEDIVKMLEAECGKGKVNIQLRQKVEKVEKTATGFQIISAGEIWRCEKLVVATGGLSMPALGATPLGYQIAESFNLNVVPPRASLVPFTWRESDKFYSVLAGIALPIQVTAQNGQSFAKQMLFTHRGLSGPAMLQISNYWQPTEALEIDFLPTEAIIEVLQGLQQSSPKLQLKTVLTRLLPARLVNLWLEQGLIQDQTLANLSKAKLNELDLFLHHFKFYPNGTEGYRTAEVTSGGVDTSQVSSKTMQANNIEGLYFIGEVLDVTGWLGGYNFQWAWSSAYACAQGIID